METAYQQQALRSANGIELILALYDGAIRFLHRAIQCVEEHDEIGCREAAKRAIDIISYLQARLRTDIGGKPAATLADFYTAMFTMTVEASHVPSGKQFGEVIACLRNVRDAWAVVARDPEAQGLLPRELTMRADRTSSPPDTPVLAELSHDQAGATRWSA
jgi:flagellar protein FliS